MAVHTTTVTQKSSTGPTMPDKHVRLLRKPRAPRPLDPLPQSPAPRSYTSEVFQEHSFTDYASIAPYYKTSSVTHPKSGDTRYTNGGRDSRLYSYLNPGELKYILDPVYRNKTSLGTYVEGQPLLKPYKPRGPDALPLRAPRTHPPILSGIFEENMERYCEHPRFTLQDFLLRVSESEKVPLQRVQEVAFSRHTYREIQQLLSQLCMSSQSEVHQIQLTMDDDLPDVTPRIPQKQLLIEMAALVKEQMSQLMHTQMKTLIRPLPKYSPSLIPGQPAPHTEIVLYEDVDAEKSEERMVFSQDQSYPSRDSVVHSSTGKIFQGARRSNEPFVSAADEGVITPSELAILDSMMNRGVALSLKAHFICELPDIELLRATILYLNLSFNDFRIIPFEVFELQQLTVLKMRNNPIHEITSDIATLKNLKTLVISFCLIATLPPGLFNLRKLEHLDLAYNRISFIPNEIKKLKSLRLMNVEGNQLCALPCGALQLTSLKYLNVKNNYMHPLFWREHSRNSPQRLVDLAAMTIASSGVTHDGPLQDAVDKLINRHSTCDCCQGALYGPGLRIIRPVPYIFGIKHLPFIFHCCSLRCLQTFKSSTAAIVSVLYGVGQS